MLLKWTLALLAVGGAFTISGVVGALVAASLGLWSTPGAGFSAAFAVVVVAYLAPPSYKLAAVFAALIVGSGAAWMLLEPSFYPESYGILGAYEPTHLPVVATYSGALFGLLALACIRHWARPNNLSKPTSRPGVP